MGIRLQFVEDPAAAAHGRQPLGPAVEFCSTAEFFNFGQMLGEMLVLLQQEDRAELLQQAADDLKAYIAPDRERYEAVFQTWWQLVSMMTARLAEHRGEPKPPPIDASGFRPEARAFLGRLVLSGEAVDPQQAPAIARILGASAGFLRVHLAHHQDQTDLRHALASAYEKLEILLQFCARAAEEGKAFCFVL